MHAFMTAPKSTFKSTMRGMKALVATSLMLFAAGASADITDDEIRILVLTDVVGPYSQASGQGSMIAAQLAADEFGGEINGNPIRIFLADSKNKPDIAVEQAKKYKEEHNIDIITDMPSSAVAINVQNWAKENGVITMNIGAGSEALTGAFCSPLGIHWQFNTGAFTTALGEAVGQTDAKKWFVITLDHAFGRSIYNNIEKAIQPYDGEIIGSIYHGFAETSFFDYIQEAMDSGTDVIAFGNAGKPLVAALRQAKELGVSAQGVTVVSILTLLQDIRALGLYATQGMRFVTAYYWDQNEGTRAFSERFWERNGAPPSSAQISVYTSTLHYLKAVQKSGDDSGQLVVDTMKEMPVEDGINENAYLRKDGRMVHDLIFVEVKKPAESKGAQDYLKILKRIPGDVAFAPPSGDCPWLDGPAKQ